VEYQIQAIGSLGLAHPRPPGQLFCDVRLLHFALNISGDSSGKPAGTPGGIPQAIENNAVDGFEKHKNFREWENGLFSRDELILIAV
jgi:hypothetical protein